MSELVNTGDNLATVIDRQNLETLKPDNKNISGGELLRETIANLRVVLDNERAHLGSNRKDLLESFAREKLQIFANLDRVSRDQNMTDNLQFSQQEIAQLNKALKENIAALKFRMDAIGEIATTIKDAVVEAESDGTYRACNIGDGFDPW